MNNSDQIKAFTAAKIHRLLSNPSESAVRASLARLRRGIGHAPGEIPELWGECLLDLPEALVGYGEPSRAEWAIYTALTMFALHQQGRDRKNDAMHREENSLGAAARCLMDSEEDRERISRRFYPVATASDMAALSHHLRGLVALLRAKDIPLDYVRLATDLYFFQNPDTADKVRLCWGEDFCRLKTDNQ
ncbi:MAG: type I-E CRISPR-associated protein Cse2/CasB [Clostridiales bacterium]|nr:type I-E CRISPR-associated protein Cse2/CasB [Candidatus Cacconaster stercorequi]